ncbi:MAG TPA: polyphosphate kinase 2 [Stellaceae bacterium]|jgi:polyphosphate kinase 2|nr:polyphosphate kinase 2 [Stellaceae bacterium]
MAKAPTAPLPPPLSSKAYEHSLLQLQIELVKLQRQVIGQGQRVLVILEGRDTAGKDGAIKRIVEHMSPRETRVVALGPPSARDERSWYFQRYVPYLPVSGEIVVFNRSWYNRAGVERVMGFCTKAETEEFLETVPQFEAMLIRAGVNVLKYYLDITKHEQKQRLADRRKDPLKQWKLSPIDNKAPKLWKDYSKARDRMLERTHNAIVPWTIVRADDKEHARLNIIRDMLWRLDYPDRHRRLQRPDPNVVLTYDPTLYKRELIAP